jgi:hypothetical protein
MVSMRLRRVIALAFAVIAMAALRPMGAAAVLAPPSGVNAFASLTFVEGVPFDRLEQDVYLEWLLVDGAQAYEIRERQGRWRFVAESLATTVAPGDPRIPVAAGVPLDITWLPGTLAQWRLPLGPLASASPKGFAIFPQGATVLEIRALPTTSSPPSEASEPVTFTIRWREQASTSSVKVTPTPWGVRVSRASSTKSTLLAQRLTGRLDASLDGTRFRPLEQQSTAQDVSTWDAVRRSEVGIDPGVWPRWGYVLADGYTLGRFRIGSTVFDPASRRAWYRQTYRGELIEKGGWFVRVKSSRATVIHSPKPSPLLRRVVVGTPRANRTNAWTATLSAKAAARGAVRWRLYERAAGTTTTTLPEKAWVPRRNGTATISKAGSSARYRLAVPVGRPGTWRLDVYYSGSAVARPQGYSVTFRAR